jgi:hypothetical protein
MNAPISTLDAASMYRRKVTPNMPPYDAMIIKLNNNLVDEWEETVLKKIADKQCRVPCSKVHFSWSVFAEGKELWSRQQFQRYLPQIPDEVAVYWVNVFHTNSVEQLHSFGLGLLAYGWLLLSTAIREYFVKEKWEKVYSKSSDPQKWLALANDNSFLMSGKLYPFTLTEDKYKDIKEKYESMMRNRVAPQ